MGVSWREVHTLVAILGLVYELEECLESRGCDIQKKLREIKEEITYKLAQAGRGALG